MLRRRGRLSPRYSAGGYCSARTGSAVVDGGSASARVGAGDWGVPGDGYPPVAGP